MALTSAYVILDHKTNFPVEVLFSSEDTGDRARKIRMMNVPYSPRYSCRAMAVSVQDPAEYVKALLEKEGLSDIVKNTEFVSEVGIAIKVLQEIGNQSFIDELRRFCSGELKLPIRKNGKIVKRSAIQLLDEEKEKE